MRVAQRRLDARGHLPRAASAGRRARWPGPSPARRGRRPGGRGGRPGRMSHSMPRRTRNGASALVGRGDLLGLAADVVGREARARRRPPACGRRSRGTRSRARSPRGAISSTLARPSDQVVWQCRSPRMSATSSSAGGSPRNGASRSSGGHHGSAERRVDRRLVGRVRQRLERGDVRRPSPSRAAARCRTRRAARRPARPARPRPSRRPRAARPLEQRDDLRQRRRSARAPAPGRRPRTTTASRSARRASGARRPPTSPSERRGDRRRRARARAAKPMPCSGRGSRASRASAASSCASIFGPTPGTSRSRPSAAASRSSSGVRTPSARASSTERFAPSPR